MDDLTVDGLAATPFDQHRRDQYLAFGYVAEPTVGDPLSLLDAWSRRPRRDEASVSESGLVREGVRALRAAFAETAAGSGAPGGQVVLLSGGLDSRTILGGLLEAYRPAELLAATFGLPGEKDFDFAAEVARAAGVRHEVLESFSVDWTTEGLVDSVLARQVPLPHPYGQRYLSYHLHRRIGPDHVFWDGLCGDAVSGAHLPKDAQGEPWEQAVARFVAGQVVAGSGASTSRGFRPASVVPAAPLCSEALLSYPDQLDLAVRQARYIATRRLRGYTVRTPFLAGPWLDFMLGVPVRHRTDQRLYAAVQREAYPRLFALPATGRGSRGVLASRWAAPARAARQHLLRGARRGGLRPGGVGRASGANDAIRRSHLQRADVREVVLGNLEDLAARGVVRGLEPGAVRAAVLEQRISHTRISTLLGVELNLKALDRLADAAGAAVPGPRVSRTPHPAAD